MNPRAKAAGVLAAVFVAGGVAGGSLAVHVVASKIHSVYEGDPRTVLGRMYARELGRRLGLGSTQRTEIERIVDDDHPELARMGQALYPQMAELRRRRHSRIRSLLTAEQARTFDTMAEAYEQRRRAEVDLP